MPAENNDQLTRLEAKMDKMSEALNQLVVMTERMTHFDKRLTTNEEHLVDVVKEIKADITVIKDRHQQLKDETQKWKHYLLGGQAAVILAFWVFDKIQRLPV